jgi:hypothetical protein
MKYVVCLRSTSMFDPLSLNIGPSSGSAAKSREHKQQTGMVSALQQSTASANPGCCSGLAGGCCELIAFISRRVSIQIVLRIHNKRDQTTLHRRSCSPVRPLCEARSGSTSTTFDHNTCSQQSICTLQASSAHTLPGHAPYTLRKKSDVASVTRGTSMLPLSTS